MLATFRLSYAVAALLLVLGVEAEAQEHPAYVGSGVCADCHSEQTELWEGSHHAWAWTEPSPDRILGDFNDTSFTLNGVTSRFYRDGETYMIDTDGPDGEITSYPVHSVVGIEPLQQYLLETEPGKLQSFDVVWDTEENRWYHLYPDQQLYGGQGLHWTGPYKNWQARCAECHATEFEKNYSPATKQYSSAQSEIGVGCEACHGPGEAHVAWAEKLETTQSPWTGLTDVGLTIDMSAGGETYLQQCATCHARREPFGDGNPLPGTALHDSYRLSTLRDGIYHADGQILAEVYVYGSFLQSKMYQAGVTCNNCHEPHSGELRVEGNGICAQCHTANGNPAFPTLSLKNYDTPEHHFHEAGTDGAQCKSCHMIERDYMVVDGRRDHSFRIPRPDLFTDTLAPNACTDCHADQSAQWAASTIEKWYPDSEHRGSHYGQTLAAGRNDLQGNLEELAALAEYEALPGIVRATALEMIDTAQSSRMASRLAPLLEDPDPLVRAGAVSVQLAASPAARAARLSPMLSDPVKAVRIAAAREFLNMRGANLTPEARAAAAAATREWQETLLAKADFPENQMVLAGIGLTLRQMEPALQAFGEAVELDPQLEQAWVMIIRIHAAMGNTQAARESADRAVSANPDSVDLNLLRSDLN